MAIQASEIQTVNVHAKENIDRTSGNAYVSVQTTVVLKTGEVKLLKSWCQIGSSDFFEQLAMQEVAILLEINRNQSLTKFCREHGITLFRSKNEKCKYRDVVAWGKN